MDVLEPKHWTVEYFLKNSSSCATILENSNALKEVPSLEGQSVQDFKDGQFVRFRGMIQDMYDPEFYFESYEVTNLKTNETDIRCGKFTDATSCRADEEICVDSKRNKTSERQTYFLISVPGLNEWAKEKRQISIEDHSPSVPTNKRTLEEENSEEMDCSEPLRKREKSAAKENSEGMETESNSKNPSLLSKEFLLNFPIPNDEGKACIVKIYDNSLLPKLNEVHEIYGFLSLDPILSAFRDSEDFMADVEFQAHNPPASLIPRLHAVKVTPVISHQIPNIPELTSKAECIRGNLHMVLSQMLFGDKLAADYLICHLISSIYVRKDCFTLGSFPLSIINFPKKYDEFPQNLYEVLSLLVPKSHYLEITLNTLNDLTFIPKKDYECNRLASGILQLSNNTHLVIDETKLTTGQVTPSGRTNYEAISNLIKFQQVTYDFQYSKMEYETDIPVLILSERKSFIPCSLQLPLKIDEESEKLYPHVIEAAKQFLKDEQRSREIREYLEYLRHLEFEFDEDVLKEIQEDFVVLRQSNKNISQDDLHCLMVLSRLLSLSNGSKVLTSDFWKKSMQMEKERLGRLP